jgi:hypothetical protein
LKSIFEEWHHGWKCTACQIDKKMGEAKNQDNLKIHIENEFPPKDGRALVPGTMMMDQCRIKEFSLNTTLFGSPSVLSLRSVDPAPRFKTRGFL